MSREMINDQNLDGVVGGTILFSPDLTTCGKNCDNQYKVLNFDAVMDYINKNKSKMTERKMLSNMVNAGLLASIPTQD